MSGTRVVLAVDDASDDQQLLRLAVEHAGTPCELRTADGGKAALEYLAGEGAYADRRKFPVPDLILLDIQMPVCDGFCVLQWLRAREEYRRLPVVMLTTSHDVVDVKRAYDLGANSFLVKPTGFGELSAMVKTTLAYWLPYNRGATL